LSDACLGKGRADLLGTLLFIAKLGFNLVPQLRGNPYPLTLAGVRISLDRDVTVR
jgi:hypothetical protein